MCHQCIITTNAANEPYWLHAHTEQRITVNAKQTVKADPAQQAGTRRRAMTELRKRLRGARDEVLALVDSIPIRKITVNAERYVYELSPERVAGIDAVIREIVARWFSTQTETHPARWFFDPFVDTPTQQGTAQAANRISMLAGQAGYSTAVLTQFEVAAIMMSEPYRRRIELVHGRVFNEMKGFTGQTATELARVLTETVSLGRSPREAQRLIRQRFDVANSRAERIARTEINNAYTTARLEEQQRARDIGVDVRVVHRSALIATTRPWHAARHGRVYTIEEQESWWSEGANRIMCLCSVSEVVYDSEGKPYDQGLLKKLRKERMDWAA